MRPFPIITTLACVIGLGIAGCGSDEKVSAQNAQPATVVDVLVARPTNSTLVSAVSAQGLVPTLSGAGPFTVFAPTNAAFTAFGTLPSGAALTSTLTYHVAPARILAADALAVAAGAGQANSVQTSPFYVDKVGADLYINQAKVITTNLLANNGVVHVIDGVLTVPTTIYDTLTTYGLTSLKSAVDTAGLAGALQGSGTFTVFAPTNAAFTTLGPVADVAVLTDVLKYHVLTSTVKASAALVVAGNAAPGNQVGTLLGSNKKIALTVAGGALEVNDIPVTRFNIRATNGVIHVIGTVLIPPAGG